jgi:hypothetical protein
LGGARIAAVAALPPWTSPTERAELRLSNPGGHFIKYRLLDGPERITQVDSHPYEMTARKPLEKTGTLQPVKMAKPPQRTRKACSPVNGNGPGEGFSDHVAKLKNAEETRMTIDGGSPDSRQTVLPGGHGVLIQDAKENVSPCHSQGFLEGQLRVADKLQRGNQRYRIESIVFIGQIFGKSAIQGNTLWHQVVREIEHIGGRVQTRNLMSPLRKPFQEKPRTATNLEDTLRSTGRPQPLKQVFFNGKGSASRFREKPVVVVQSIFKLEDVTHALYPSSYSRLCMNITSHKW